MTQVCSVILTHCFDCGDWLRSVRVTQVRPVRLNSGIFVRFVREKRLSIEVAELGM